jgi:hypothetical protein
MYEFADLSDDAVAVKAAGCSDFSLSRIPSLHSDIIVSAFHNICILYTIRRDFSIAFTPDFINIYNKK